MSDQKNADAESADTNVENSDQNKNQESSSKIKKNKFWRRVLKFTAAAVGIFLSIIIVLIIILLLFRDPIIKTAITKGGSWATGLDISLDKFETSLSDGEVKIINLKITNPAGYDQPSMLELDSFFLALDINTLNSDEIVIKTIEIDGLRATAEFNKSGKFNVVELADNLNKKFPPPENPETEDIEKEENSSEKSDDEPQASVAIESLAIRNSRVTVMDDRIGIPTYMPLAYDSQNLNFERSGESFVEIFSNLASQLEYAFSGVANAGELVVDTGKLLINSTGNAGKKLIDSTGNAGKLLIDSTGKAGKQLLDSTGNAGEQLKKSGKKLLDSFKF